MSDNPRKDANDEKINSIKEKIGKLNDELKGNATNLKSSMDNANKLLADIDQLSGLLTTFYDETTNKAVGLGSDVEKYRQKMQIIKGLTDSIEDQIPSEIKPLPEIKPEMFESPRPGSEPQVPEVPTVKPEVPEIKPVMVEEPQKTTINTGKETVTFMTWNAGRVDEAEEKQKAKILDINDLKNLVKYTHIKADFYCFQEMNPTINYDRCTEVGFECFRLDYNFKTNKETGKFERTFNLVTLVDKNKYEITKRRSESLDVMVAEDPEST